MGMLGLFSSAVASNSGEAAALTAVPNLTWTQQANGPYSKREGLMGVSYNESLFLSGGRTTGGLGFSDEVWRSSDLGATWTLVASKQFPGRAYHVMLVVDDCMLITGGQTFTSFYNDVWKSCDGEGRNWTQVVKKAPFPGRAGLAATVTSKGEVIIAGGCYNKNGNPAARSFWGDVWASVDGGLTWNSRSNSSGWKARSGPRLIEDTAHGRLLLVAGEVGFTPSTQLQDIWGSKDGGMTWFLVASNPGFSPRSGHGVVVLPKTGVILCIAGWPHLHDLWASTDGGANFTQVSNAVWNCDSDKCGKFDFWPIIHQDLLFTIGGSAAYSTFGSLWQDTWIAKPLALLPPHAPEALRN